jgi:hypothetical protein
MQKHKIITIVIIISVLAISSFFIYFTQKEQKKIINSEKQNEVKDKILGNKEDLLSFSILPQEVISGEIKISGIIKGAYFFEGNILINILDENKNLLKAGYANAITDWMTIGPVSFEGVIDLGGIPAGKGFVQIHNDNASGLPEKNKSILIPVMIK